MPRDRDNDQLNQDQFSLEAILAEFGSGSEKDERTEEAQAAPFAAPAQPEGEAGDRPAAPPPQREESAPKKPEDQAGGRVTSFPKAVPRIVRKPSPPQEPPPPPKKEAKREEKVLEFPAAGPENRVAAGIDHLRRKADQFAEHMYEAEEDSEAAQAVRRVERLIPGVDEEETPPPAPNRERKPRKQRPPAPDLPPADLAKRYAKELKGMRLRSAAAFILTVAALALTLAMELDWTLPEPIGGDAALLCWILAGSQGLVLLLTGDRFLQALIRPFRGQMGMELLIALANIAILADALTLPLLTKGEIVRQPFCAVAALGMWSVFKGSFHEKRGQRTACRMAASASEPYLVTRDEGKWNNRDTYAKWSGPLNGFGSQIQGENGAERIYRVVVPLLLAACILFSLLSSVGRQRPWDFLWSLSATLAAAGSLSATFCFGLPWRKISARLSKSGAALAGWQGATNTTGSCNLLLTDIDLFPVGSVSLNGVKIFGDFHIEKVIAVTATVIRDSGSALDKVFHDLLRSQGAVYRRGEKLTAFEGGGLSEIIRGEQILIGSASFMALMDVPLPPGLKVKNAVFCAIGGDLAGIFALNYHLPGSVPPAIDALIQNRITPVLATRDFNLIPSMLRQRFKLPVEKMEFPPVNRRRELSDPDQEHSQVLTAVLCREGVGPYAEAAVGSRRLRAAVRLSAALSCLGSAVGALLAFYLTCVGAYTSLTAVNLAVFLLAWFVPIPFIAGWVDRY